MNPRYRAIAALCFLAASACSSSPPPSDATATIDDPAAIDDPIIDLLDLVPDRGTGVDGVTISLLGELLSLAEIQPDVQAFCDENNVDSVSCDLLAIKGWERPYSAIPVLFRDKDADELERAFGVNVRDVQASIDVPRPDGTYTAFVVTTPDQVVLDRAAANEQWAPDLEKRNDSGFEILDWGEGIDIPRRDSMRTMGRGGQLAVADGLVVRTDIRNDLSVTLDDVTPRLGSLPHVREIAALLTERDALSMTFFDSPEPMTGPGAGLAAWEVAGVGVTVRAGRMTVWLVHAHATEAMAQKNQTLLQQDQMLEPTTAELVETTIEGVYLISELQRVGPGPDTYLQLIDSALNDGPFFGLE